MSSTPVFLLNYPHHLKTLALPCAFPSSKERKIEHRKGEEKNIRMKK
jgi:hypothetical protein